MTLDWTLLSQLSCPKCGETLEKRSLAYDGYVCSDKDCDFKITRTRLMEITESVGEFTGFCEMCGKKIPEKFRTCRNCI